MCTISSLISTIRKSLNECNPSSKGGCGCNDRYTDDDIKKAIVGGVNSVVTIRPDQFTDDVDFTVEAGQCRINLCAGGCDTPIKFSYSKSDPCYVPDRVSVDAIGKTEKSGNKCFEWSSDSIEDSTVYQWYFDPKSPCEMIVDRESIDNTTEVVIVCANYPDLSDTDELPKKICDRFLDVVYHSAIYHLIDRDHRPTQAFTAYANSHRDSAAILMRDINNADKMAHGCNYLGVKADDCD